MDAPSFGMSHPAYDINSQVNHSLEILQPRETHLNSFDHDELCQTSKTIISLQIFLQALILALLILAHWIHQNIRDQRAKDRDKQRSINYDIERQTSRPPRKVANHADIMRTLQERYSEPPTSYTLTESELADPNAWKPAIKPAKKKVRWKLDHPQPMGESRPLLPVTCPHMKRRRTCLPSSLSKIVFLITLHTRYSTRKFLKRTQCLGHKIHAWTMCQSERLPLFGSNVPSNGVSLAIGSMVILNMIFLFICLPLDGDFLAGLTRRAAMLQAANTPVLYLLSMKTQPLQFLAGRSYEHVNIFHRRLGELCLFLSALHSAGHILPILVGLFNGVRFDRPDPVGGAVAEGFTYFSRYVLAAKFKTISGCAVLLSCIAIFATSVSSFRHRSYQLFLLIHGPLQGIFLGLAWMHSTFARPFIAIAIAIYILDRFVFRHCLRAKRLTARTLSLKDHEVIQLGIDRPRQALKLWDRLKCYIASHLAAPWAPGCHVLMTVRSLDAPYNKESHPLYLLSARDKTDAFFRKNEIQLLVKAYGDWSSNLVAIGQSQPTLAEVELEGPYGSCCQQELMRDRDVCILVASSCGMVSILPIAQSLVDWDHGRDPITNDVKPRRQEILLILVHREYQNVEWYETQMQRLEGSGIDCIALGPSEIYWNPAPQLRNTIDWFIETRDARMDKRIGILCSGPPEMQRTVRAVASKARAEGYQCVIDCLSFTN